MFSPQLPPRGLSGLQRIALSLMGFLTVLTFVAANLHAVLWQSSEWLVSTVLPAVIVELTNEERADNAALPLRRSTTLDQAAQLKAEHMAKNQYFAHYSPDGVTPWHWFDEAGYLYAHAGENLAIHFTDSAEVVEAWMDSPTHRKNIVDGKFTEIGVGTAKGEYEGYKTVYVVQLFGTPAVPPPVVEKPPSLPPPAAPPVVVEPQVTEPLSEFTPDEPAVGETLPPAVAAATPAETPSTSAVVEPPVAEPDAPAAAKSDTTPAPAASESEPVPLPPVAVAEAVPPPLPSPADVVVLQTALISTSSGLAVAQVTSPVVPHAGATLSSMATQPNTILQFVYTVLAVIVTLLLSTSVAVEARRLHVAQVAYGVLLLVAMGGLWFAHWLLTAGAVVV